MLYSSNILTCCRIYQLGGNYYSLKNVSMCFSFTIFVLCFFACLFVSLRTVFRRNTERTAYGYGKG